MRHFVFAAFLLTLFGLACPILGQSPTATVNGLVRDPSGAVVAGAEVQLINEQTNVKFPARTNREGIYIVPNLPPGAYRIQVSKPGFKTIIKPDIILNVLDARAINFDLPVGAASETVTVDGGAALIDPESSSVSTVVDRQFAENIPLNGRSFQSLIQLTPGVVLTANNGSDTGQFSVNGQRANSNYWMVDGVSANVGISASQTPGSGMAGTLGSTSVLGGTNSLVSVDALQEFRIQTSTYAPEFGRTPGGQISIVTRSGTNQFHGTAFDYFRNDSLDANDWFANNVGLPRPRERQNDFGGTFSGPILRNNTFVFFSYEGLRLRLPQTALTYVPDASFTPGGTTNSRQNAIPELQPYLNAFPLPNRNSPEKLCDPNTDFFCPASGISGSAAFNASYSNPATLDAYSLRVDHKFSDRFNLFGRYNYSPSSLTQRGDVALSVVSPTTTNTQTTTLGALWAISPTVANDLRFNYSSTDASVSYRLDNFGGAVPLGTLPFPNPFTARNAQFGFAIFGLNTNQSSGGLLAGTNAHNEQRQLNILDNVSLQEGSHSLKFGVDYRRLSPHFGPAAYTQSAGFFDVPSAEAGSLYFGDVISSLPVTFLFRNLGLFAQDTWRIVPRLTMSYGLRWDVDFVPSSLSGPEFPAVTGFNLSDLSNLALAPSGTPPYKTKWGNLAPRIGLAYQVSQSQRWQTVLRGGFGVFYDLASSEAGNTSNNLSYPFGSFALVPGNFPFSPADAAPPPILPPTASNPWYLYAFDPNLGLPHTLQWNIAIEQALGKQQTLTASYVGAAGRRLVQTAFVSSPNPIFVAAQLVTNAGASDYHALQLQFQRRLSRGLQALTSYSWSHSLDTASAGSLFVAGNAFSPLNSNTNRGPSDFDVRNAFSIALTYDVPTPQGNAFAKAILRGWSTENIIQAQSAPPVNVVDGNFTSLSNLFQVSVRPDVVPGQPVYLYGAGNPGGKALNPAAFASPPTDPVTGLPTRQGDLSRNALRGFGSAQWDFAVHREFVIHESLKLQFRAELFNVLNHPNFGPPDGNLTNLTFGQSTQMLGRSLNGPGGSTGTGSGGFNPLYQLGGPRSIQFGLKLSF